MTGFPSCLEACATESRKSYDSPNGNTHAEHWETGLQEEAIQVAVFPLCTCVHTLIWKCSAALDMQPKVEVGSFLSSEKTNSQAGTIQCWTNWKTSASEKIWKRPRLGMILLFLLLVSIYSLKLFILPFYLKKAPSGLNEIITIQN